MQNKAVRASDTPFIADWFTVSLRWLTLTGLSVTLAISSETVSPFAFLLVFLALTNVAQMLLAGLNVRLKNHRLISLSMDLIIGIAYFILIGGYTSSTWWVGLVAILTAAIYFEERGAIITASLIGVTQAVVTWVQTPVVIALLYAVGIAIFFLGFSGGFGYLAHHVYGGLRSRRMARLEKEERERQIETERLKAIYALTTELLSTLDYRHVLDAVLDLSAKVLDPQPESSKVDPLVCAVLLIEGPVLNIGSARRFTSADMRVTLPGVDGMLGQVIDEGESMRMHSFHEDQELSRIVALRACKSGYCFPLRSGFNIYGVLLFAHPNSDYFTDDRCELIDILGRQAVVAMQNARLYQDLVEEQERMVEVQEEARKKLARDLHDGPTQSVSAIAMRINLARRMLEKTPDAVGGELSKVEDLARRTTKEIRHMLFTLRPLVLESQGLTAALQAMAEKMKETFDQNVLVKVDESLLEQLEMGKQGVIFYIVEEAVNNARKHARARNIWVNLRTLRDEIALLQIQDDGLGFDLETVMGTYDQRGSLGMINLRERSELVNGLLHVDSAPGKGTNVQVFIPLSEKAADRLRHAK